MSKHHLLRIVIGAALSAGLCFTLPAHSQPQAPSACANPSLTISATISLNRGRAAIVDDFNNDGKPDVAIGKNSFLNPIAVLLGDGAGGFAASINTDAGSGVLSLASADFNGDGKKDLLIGNRLDGGGEAAVVLGDGAGGFGPQKSIFLFGGMTNQVPAVATGDMNGDGKQDLILLVTDTFGNGSIVVMHGDGANNYTVASTTFIGITSGAMAVTDLNGDSKLDVVATQTFPNGAVVTLLGDGAGHLATPAVFNAGGSPTAITIADFNGDGKKDVATANVDTDDVSILLGDGSGNLATPAKIADVGDQPLAIAKADFDGNGAVDLVVVSVTPGTATILLNQGAGAFVKSSNFFFGSPVFPTDRYGLIDGDFNLDSKPDLFVVNESRNLGWALLNGCDTVAPQIIVAPQALLGFESAGLNPPVPGTVNVVVARSGNVTGAASVDFHTSDGTAIAQKDYTPAAGTLNFAPGEFFKTVPVLLIDDNVTEPLELFSVTLANAAGSSTLGTPNVAQVTIVDEDPAPSITIHDAAITEGNTNASADLAVTMDHPSAFPITVHFETADGSATAGSDYQSTSGTVSFAPAQVAQTISVPVNGDTTPEITETFTVNLSTPTNSTIADAQGIGTIRDDDSTCPEPSFGPLTNFTVGSNPLDLVTADFNGDGKADLATANFASGNVSVLLGTGVGGFATAVNLPVLARPQAIAAGDFNSDNKPDLIVAGQDINDASGTSILLNDGAGGFAAANTTIGATSLIDVAVADFNGDNKLDLALLSLNGSVAIRFGDGSGGFGAPASYSVGTNPVNVVAANVNGDTKPDLIVANQNSQNLSVLLNNGDGTFAAATNFTTGLNPQQIATGDINSDGKLDLVVPLSSNGAIAVLLGDGTGAFTPGTNLTVGVRVDRLVLADLNGDGLLDLAVSDVSSDFVTPVNAGVWISFGNGAGKFTAPTQYPTTKSPYAIVAGNFDGDQKTDLAFAQLQSTSVGVLFNTCSVALPGPLITLNASRINVAEAAGSVSFNVRRSGNTQTQASVDYAAADTNLNASSCSDVNGKASARCDYLQTVGTLTFAPNETSKTLTIPLVDDSFAEGDETFDVVLSNASGGSLSTPSALTITILDNDVQNGTNPIDTPEFFVRQHYIDFLNREPDQSGLDFWVANFTQCAGNQQCLDVRRVNVSAAFFLSIEFQQTGYLVERIYKTAYGDRSGSSTLRPNQLAVPIIRFNEFLVDSQKIRQGVVVGQGNWADVLELNKQSFVEEFVTRTRFTAALPASLTPAQYVDQLNANAGHPLSQAARDQLIAGLTGGQITRGQVLRTIAEDPALSNTEFNRAFVLMQYFGYLRRDPDSGPDTDYTGYDFWLTKLDQFNGSFTDAEMVKAFLNSLEYRGRFGP